MAWSSRIWTVQEYLLAKSFLWLGADGLPLRLRATDIYACLQTRRLNDKTSLLFSKLDLGTNISQSLNLDRLANALSLKLGYLDPSQAMALAEHRQSQSLEDEIYGLMNASGVVTYPPLNNSLSPQGIWQIWWTAALKRGILRWALLPVISSQPKQLSSDTSPEISHVWNCAMPPFVDYQQASRLSSVNRMSPWDCVSITDGTVYATGKLFGVCQVDVFLGKCSINDLFLLEASLLTHGDHDLAKRFCSAYWPHLSSEDRAESLVAAYNSIMKDRIEQEALIRGLLQNYDESDLYLGTISY